MERDRQRFPVGQNPVMEAKPSKEFKNSETLFKSVDKPLTEEYLQFFEESAMAYLSMYREAELDGTEDAMKCRMLAAMRLAQFGLSMFSFFSSCAMSIRNGNADTEACNATAKVVSMMVETKTDGWITKSRKGLN